MIDPTKDLFLKLLGLIVQLLSNEYIRAIILLFAFAATVTLVGWLLFIIS